MKCWVHVLTASQLSLQLRNKNDDFVDAALLQKWTCSHIISQKHANLLPVALLFAISNCLSLHCLSKFARLACLAKAASFEKQSDFITPIADVNLP